MKLLMGQQTLIEDVSKELKKLRDVAHTLDIPNADSIFVFLSIKDNTV